MQLSIVDLIVLLAYVGAVVVVGCSFVRKSRTTDEFMAAGRSLPGWVVGLSIFGTYLSSITFLAYPGRSYDTNFNAFVFSLSLPLTALIAVKFFVPYYRKLGSISAYSALEKRFGLWARTYAVVCYLLLQLARMGTILYLVALPLHQLLGLDVRWVIVIAGALIILYTLLGGIRAVIWTDVVQSIVLTVGAVIAALVLLFGMPEGPGQIFTIAAEHSKFSLGSFGASLAIPTFWVVLLYGSVENLKNFGIDQSYIQRYITAKSEREAKKSVWLGAMLYIPVSALFLFIGVELFAYYTAQPELLSATVVKGDQVFPHFIVTGLPVGVTGILIAAVFAAAMSSVDSSLNCSATLILSDIYKRYFNKDASEKASMRVLYGTTLVWGILGVCMALAMIQVKSALDAWWKLAGILSGGMLGLFLLGLMSRRAKNLAGVIGVACGVCVILWMTFSPGWETFRSPFHGYLIATGGTLTILLVGFFIGTLIAPKNGPTEPDSSEQN